PRREIAGLRHGPTSSSSIKLPHHRSGAEGGEPRPAVAGSKWGKATALRSGSPLPEQSLCRDIGRDIGKIELAEKSNQFGRNAGCYLNSSDLMMIGTTLVTSITRPMST